MSSNSYSVILGNLGNTCDRFLSTGYKDPISNLEKIQLAASIPGIEGIGRGMGRDPGKYNGDQGRDGG